MGVSWLCYDSWDYLVGSWITIPVAVLWAIWKERNSRIFEGKTLEFSELFQKAKWGLCVWLCSNKEFKDLKSRRFLSV